MRKALALTLLALCLTAIAGCRKMDDSAETTLPPETTEMTTIETEPEPITISPIATKDYLLPLENFSAERQYDPRFVMIHFTSAVLVSRDDPYNMDTIRSVFEDYEVSVHYIIDRDGVVRCYVPENLVAWHAGKGEWKGNPEYTDKMNQYAIGIEVVAIGSESDMAQYMTEADYAKIDPSLLGYTNAQYEALKELVEDICLRNNIPMDRDHVIGHEEYSSSKSDPGQFFDWDRLIKK